MIIQSFQKIFYSIAILQFYLIGAVGITLNCDWFEPYDSTDESHVEAALTKLQFFVGWFANPIYVNGKYPEIMREKV